MIEYLAVAGILSAVALLLREVRLMMVEARRWLRPPTPRKPREKKEPPGVSWGFFFVLPPHKLDCPGDHKHDDGRHIARRGQ
jgi:hypothetical protein